MRKQLLTGLFAAIMAAQAHSVPVKDQNGHMVDVPNNVERVVSITIPLASMIMAIDQSTERLVGMHKASRMDIDHGLLGRIFPEAEHIPHNMSGEGFVPNVEALASQAPDLVFQWGDRGENIVRPLRQLGLPVLTLKYGDSAWAADWLRMVGQALGKPERGNRLADWFEQRLDQTLQQAASLEQQPRALYLFRTRSGFQVAGANTSMGSDLDKVGALNMAAEVPGFASVDIEQLMVWDPELILLNNFEPGLSPEDLYDDPRLQGISAVRERRVYVYPYGGFRWDPPSQETPLSLDWLFTLAHPEHADPGLRQRIREGYRLLYDYEVSEQDLDDLLRLELNAGSHDYRRLFAREGL